MESLYLGLAAGIGGVVSGVLGWQSSKEQFDASKFIPTFLRSAAAGAGVAFAAPLVDVSFWPGVAAAFMTGAGFDAVWHHTAGTIKGK